MTRREWIALVGTALLSTCGRRKGTGFDGYALIATAGDNSLAVVDLTAFQLLKSIPLGAPPTHVIAAPTQGGAYVVTGSTGTVQVLDDGLKRAGQRKLSDQLSELRIVPGGKRAVATAAKSRELIEVETASLKVLRRNKLFASPVALDIGPPGYAAVSTGEHGVVELLNLITGQRSRTRFAGPIGELRFRWDGALLLVANLHDRSLTALDVPSLQVIADLPLAMSPENLAFNADGGQLFVSGAGMDGVAIVFPYNLLEVEQTVLAGRAPGVMTCSGSPPYLFVASRNASDVCILDIATRKMIGIVEVGGVSGYMAVTPDNQYALALDQRAGDMAVIHIPAIRGNRLKSGAALFTMIPVGDEPVNAAIVRRV